MVEKMTFEFSGLIKDTEDKKDIEFFGHDAGEFFPEEIEILPEEKEVHHETKE